MLHLKKYMQGKKEISWDRMSEIHTLDLWWLNNHCKNQPTGIMEALFTDSKFVHLRNLWMGLQRKHGYEISDEVNGRTQFEREDMINIVYPLKNFVNNSPAGLDEQFFREISTLEELTWDISDYFPEKYQLYKFD
jgi:hypothetical protein